MARRRGSLALQGLQALALSFLLLALATATPELSTPDTPRGSHEDALTEDHHVPSTAAAHVRSATPTRSRHQTRHSICPAEGLAMESTLDADWKVCGEYAAKGDASTTCTAVPVEVEFSTAVPDARDDDRGKESVAAASPYAGIDGQAEASTSGSAGDGILPAADDDASEAEDLPSAELTGSATSESEVEHDQGRELAAATLESERVEGEDGLLGGEQGRTMAASEAIEGRAAGIGDVDAPEVYVERWHSSARAGGIGSRGQGPIIGSWVDEEEEEEGGGGRAGGRGDTLLGLREGTPQEVEASLYGEDARSRERSGRENGGEKEHLGSEERDWRAESMVDAEQCSERSPTDAAPVISQGERGPLVKGVGVAIGRVGTEPSVAGEAVGDDGEGSGRFGGDAEELPDQRPDKEGLGGLPWMRGEKGFAAKEWLWKAWLTWRPLAPVLLACAVCLVVYLQGAVPRWLPFVGNDSTEGWGLGVDSVIASARSRAESFCSGRPSVVSREVDELDLPELVPNEEPAFAALADFTRGADDEGDGLMWDTRPKSFDRLVFDPVLGVVPSGVLEAWARAGPARAGGSGRVGYTASAPEGVGRTHDEGSNAVGASSPRGARAEQGLQLGQEKEKRQLPPVRYTPEWNSWREARREAAVRVQGLSETEYHTSCPTSDGGQKVGARVVVAVEKAALRTAKVGAPAATRLRLGGVGGTVSGGDAQERREGGEGGDSGGSFGENSLGEGRDVYSEVSSRLPPAVRPMTYGVA